MATDEVTFLTARELADAIRRGELSAVEVMQAHIEQIEDLNPQVNAVITFLPDQALELAQRADERQKSGEKLGSLHGLPILHKDTIDTAGIRTTSGSPILADNVPAQSSLIVERLHAAGAIPLGKTNVPEFGAGSQTFNELFGATRNPFDLGKTCGGSSGGSAVALACGMHPIADGSDMGGSLRNPANFCNVVGFRPSPGRIPVWPTMTGWFPFSLQGPMARTVPDVALLMSVMAGPDPRSPIALSEHGSTFERIEERDFSEVRVAYSPNLGELPVDPAVSKVIRDAVPVFESIGCRIDEAAPDFSDADQIFKVWRAWRFHVSYQKYLAEKRHLLKDTVIWNVEAGASLTGPEIGDAEVKRTQLFEQMSSFMQTYEFLIMPVSQVPPFDVDTPYVTSIFDGNEWVEMETYIDWMKSCYYITVTGHPAISVPCGFTDDGLPVGIQIVGRHQDDLGVLQLAYAFEQATRVGERRPPIVANM